MTEYFNAILAQDVDGTPLASLKQITLADLPDEAVLVNTSYSTLNYKDGLAVSGMGKICRTLPLICGIDLAGVISESGDSRYQPGERILVNGYGMSETFNGGYSQYQRIKPEWIVRVPQNMSLEETMAVGTAGYTSMLCVLALRDAGVTPSDGPILVTGAAGGVGSIAVSLLSSLGYEVHASTGRVASEGEFLRQLMPKRCPGKVNLAQRLHLQPCKMTPVKDCASRPCRLNSSEWLQTTNPLKMLGQRPLLRPRHRMHRWYHRLLRLRFNLFRSQHLPNHIPRIRQPASRHRLFLRSQIRKSLRSIIRKKPLLSNPCRLFQSKRKIDQLLEMGHVPCGAKTGRKPTSFRAMAIWQLFRVIQGALIP